MSIRWALTHSWDLRILAFLSGLQYSTSKCSKMAWHFVLWPFLDGRCEDLYECLDKTVDSLCKPFDALRSGTLKIWKRAIFLRFPGFWNIFQICNIPLLSAWNWRACLHFWARCCEDLYVNARWIRSYHFASQFGALRRGYCKSDKRFQIPVDSGFWYFFQICNVFFTFKGFLKWYTNDFNFF